MIKAVFFDLYNTLVRFWPPLDEIQQASCSELGLNVRKDGIRKGYVLADEYFNQANAENSLAHRSPQERGDFFAEYERLILQGAGLDVTSALARQVWEMTSLVQKELVLFDDVLPALGGLKTKGLTVGVLSNLRRNVNDLAKTLGLEPFLNFCINSAEAGAEKPNPAIFLAALERARVSPDEAAHVGDQYKADVQGAEAVGIMPVLLDREGWHRDVNDCFRIGSLLELDRVLGPDAGGPRQDP